MTNESFGRIGYDMGIKSFSSQFGSGYIVQKETNGAISIGSAYVHDLVKVTPDFEISKSSIVSDSGEAYKVYLALMEAKASGELERVLSEEDVYSTLYDVYVTENGRVIKKQCEEYGWPNITTDGQLMYENTSFEARSDALKYLRQETLYGLKSAFNHMIDAFKIAFVDRTKRFMKYFANAFRAWVFRGY